MEVDIMADICTCCGKKIPFLDVDYDYIEIDKVEYRLCGKCRSKINAYNNGNIPVEEVITDATDGKVADYIQNMKSEEDIELYGKFKCKVSLDVLEKNKDSIDTLQILGARRNDSLTNEFN